VGCASKMYFRGVLHGCVCVGGVAIAVWFGGSLIGGVVFLATMCVCEFLCGL